jgi:filamentous hemagglutinin family protein
MICIVMMIALMFQPLAMAQVVVDPSESSIYVDESVNGVPIVGINAPTNGVSQNKFSDYNVGANGLIINNSISYGMSALGGYLMGNANFGDAAASTILFDVTGRNLSKLEGIQEIFGSRANFMLSNPNGLYINGLGFINTNRVRLTTGTPTHVNQELRYDVRTGAITLGGAGLNASNVSSVDLLAHAIDVQGQLLALGDARLVAGTFQLNPLSGDVRVVAQSSDRISIDVSGDLEANSIQLIATDEGAGVNSSGQLISSAGDIVIDANGDVLLANANSANDVSVVAHSVTLSSGQIDAQKNVNMTAIDGILLDNASVMALNDISFDADDFDAMASDLTASSINIDAVDTQFNASLVVGGKVMVDATTLGMDAATTMQSAGDMTLTGQVSNAGSVVALGALAIQGASVENTGVVHANEATLSANELHQNNQLLVGNDLTLHVIEFNNSGELKTGGDLTLNGDVLINNGGVHVGGSATIEGKRGSMHIQNSGTVTVDAVLSINHASITNNGQMTLGETFDWAVDDIINRGVVLGHANSVVRANSMDNSGQWLSVGDVNLLVNDWVNSGATITAGTLDWEGFVLTNSGQIQGRGIGLTSHDLHHTGVMLSRDGIDMTQSGHVSLQGWVLATNNVSITAMGNVANQAVIKSEDVLVSANALENAGFIMARQGVRVTANHVINEQRVSANQWLEITAKTVANNGVMMSLNTLGLSASDHVANAGLVASVAHMAIETLQFTNDGTRGEDLNDFSSGIQAGGGLLINATKISNRDGLILAQGMDVNALSVDNMEGHVVDVGGHTVLNVGTFNNTGGRVESNGLTQFMGDLDNQSGLVFSGLGLSVDSVLNQNGQLLADGGAISMDMPGEFNNTNGAVINYGGDVHVIADAYVNDSGTIVAQQHLSLVIQEDFHDSGMLAAVEGDMRLHARSFVLHDALSAGGQLMFESENGFELNDGVWLFGGSGVMVSANAAISNYGVIESLGDVQMKSAAHVFNQGDIQSRGGVSISGAQLNQSGRVMADAGVILTVASDLTNAGTIWSGANAAIGATNATNTGKIVANDTLDMSISHHLINRGELLASDHLRLHNNGAQMEHLINQAGVIESLGGMTLRAKTIENLATYDILTHYYSPSSSLAELGSRNEDQPNYEVWNGLDGYHIRSDSKPPTPIFSTTKTKTYSVQNVANYHAATIQSGQDMEVSGDHFYNNVSHVTAGGGLRMGDTHLHNNHLNLTQVDRTYYTHVTYRGYSEGCNNFICWGSRRDYQHFRNSLASVDTSRSMQAKSSSMRVGGQLSMAGDYDSNRVLSHGHGDVSMDDYTPAVMVSSANLGTLIRGMADGGSAPPLSLTDATLANGLIDGNDGGLGITVSVPTLTHGIDGPGELRFERQRVGLTNMSAMDPSQFMPSVGFRSEADLIASDYFYERIKAKYPGAFRLGSEYTEQKYMERMLDQEVGRRMLYADIQTMPEQMNVWYANAEVLAESPNVVVGEPLPERILENLDRDVLWMELVEVNGTLVMAPRLYLSAKTKARLAVEGHSAQLMADVVALDGGNLNLKSGGIRANTLMGTVGALNAGKDATIDVNDMVVDASGNVTNAGRITAQNMLAITTSGTVVQSGALHSGGLMVLNAGESITDVAGTTSAKGDLVVKAGRDIQFKAKEDPNGVNHQVTQISVGGNFVVDGQGDVEFQASVADIQGSVVIHSGGDLTMRTVTDASESTQVSTEGNVTTTTVHSQAERGVRFTTGEHWVTHSGGDTTITAGQLSADGAVQMGALGDLNLLAGHSETTSESTTKTTGWVRVPSTATSKSTGAVQSAISSGAGMQLSAGKSLTISASDIVAVGDLNVRAEDTVSIVSQKDRSETTKDRRQGPQIFGLGETGTETSVEESLSQTRLNSGGVMRIDGQAGVAMRSVALDMGEGGTVHADKGRVRNTALYLQNSTLYKGRKNGREITDISMSTTGQASQITGGKLGVDIHAKDDITLAGTKIKTSGNLSLSTDEGDIALVGMVNSEYSKRQEHWTTSKWGGLVKTKHEKVSEDLNESVDRTVMEGANYSAKAGGNMVKAGSTIQAGSIYESGKDKIESSVVLSSLDVDKQSSRSSFGLGGLITVDDIKSSEHEVYERAKKHEVNENNARGTIANEFSGAMVLEGSAYAAGTGVSLKAADVALLAVTDSVDHYEKKKEQSFRGISLDANLSKMQAGASTHYKGTTDISQTYDETAKGVRIAGQGVSVEATDGQLYGEGMAIHSGNGALDIQGSEGVDFVEARERHEVLTRHSEDEKTVRSYVGNRWAQTAVSVVEAIDSGNGVDAAAKTGRLLNNIANSAESAATLGFYGGVEIIESQQTSTQRQGMDVGVGATFVSNGGMTVESENGDITMQGATAVNTGGDVEFKVDREKGKTVGFYSGETHAWQTSETDQVTNRASMETNIVGHYGGEVSHSENHQTSGTKETRQNNTMIINSGGTTRYEGMNLDLKGAESVAKVQDIEGVDHVSVESQQDRQERQESSDGWHASVSTSTMTGASMSGGGSASTGKGQKEWTNKVSRLVGSEDIKGSVDTLTLTGGQVYVQTDVFDVEDEGALIKGPEDGEMGVMSMSADRVMVSDIRDTESYESEGGNIGMSTNGTSGSMTMGGGNAGYNQSSKDREDALGSYIGKGQLSDDIASGKTRVVGDGTLAESEATTRETIKDDSTAWGGGVSNGQLTDVGNVLTGDLNGLMNEGEIGQTVQDVSGLIQAPKATGRVMDALSDLGDSVATQFTTGIDAGEVYQVKTEERQRALEKQRDDRHGTMKINNITENGTADAERVKEGLSDVVNGIQDSMGVADGERGEVTIYDGGDSPVVAYTDTGEMNQNDIGFNVGENGVDLNDGSEIWKVTVHESAHTDGEGERMAHLRTGAAKRAWGRENAYNGNVTGSREMEQSEWVNNQKNSGTTIQSGTNKARQVAGFDPYMPLFEFKAGGGELISERDIYYSNLKRNNPPKLIEEAKITMIEMPTRLNLFHTWDNEETVKFLSKDGKTEGIYNKKSGELTKNPKNRGTFNEYNPNDNIQKYLHLEDVRKYLFYGTGPDDPTSLFERIGKTFDH